MENYVNVYVGNGKEDWEDFIFAELVIKNVGELPIEESGSLGSLSGEDFLEQLGTILNKSILVTKSLKIPLKIDRDWILTEISDYFDEKTVEETKLLILEIKNDV